MKKTLITLTILILSLNYVRAQDAFAMFIKDTQYRNNTIKCFKGEVVPYVKLPGAKRINILINGEAIRNQPFPSGSLGDCRFLNLDYFVNSKPFVVANGDYIIVNANAISAKDSVTLVSENGFKILQITGRRKDSIKKVDAGKMLRLIITNTPSIYYSTDSLQRYAQSVLTDAAKANQQQTSFWRSIKFSWTYYIGLYIAIALATAGICLIKYRRWTKRWEKKPFLGKADQRIYAVKPLSEAEWPVLMKSTQPEGSKSNLEDTSFAPIINTKSANYLDELNQRKTEISRLKTENTSLNLTIKRLYNEKEQWIKEIENLKIANEEKKAELTKAKETLVDAEFLTAYCRDVLAYFKLCDLVIADAYTCFYDVSRKNLQQALGPGNLLMKFQNSIRTTRTGNWIQIVQDIADAGASGNKLIKTTFKRTDGNENKKREFKRLLFDNVLVRYSSSVLVLAEAFKNLMYFQVTPELIPEINETFSGYVTELVNKIKSTGLENKYIPLFSEYEVFISQIQLTNEEKSIAHRNVTGLKKDTIAEIVSYGVRSDFDDTKTLIILA